MGRWNHDVDVGLPRLPPRPRVDRLLGEVLDVAEVLEVQSRVPLGSLQEENSTVYKADIFLTLLNGKGR